MQLLSRRKSARARLASAVLLVVALVATVAATGWAAFGFTVDKAALLVALLTLDASLGAFLWPVQPLPPAAELADDLAGTVRLQWLDEVRARKLREPGILPLSWAATGREGLDDTSPRSVRLGEDVRLRRLLLHGRLDGRFDEVLRQLADGYRRLPRGRLVLLGEPGAGKSVLAMLLTLGLLEGRGQGTSTPVLLPVSSWDPVAEPLDDWIVRSLAASSYHGQEETPRRLLRSGLLLPVLDGLDEIPEPARRSAVHEINVAVGDDRPIVVTCRSAEYVDAIRGGAPALHEAPVVEIQPLAAADVTAYLRAVSWPPATDWTPVFERLGQSSATGDRVTAALGTPLMVSLARLVYQRGGGDPAELLDHRRFPSRHSIEDHLIDRLVEAVYAPRHPAPRQAPTRCTAAQADRWLRLLARHLHSHRGRDLEWWMLGHRLLTPWVAPGVGIAAGAVLMVAVSVSWFHLRGLFVADLPVALAAGALAGGIFGMLAMVIWSAAAGRAPGRLVLSARGSFGRLCRGLRNGSAVAGIAGALAVAGSLVAGLSDGWSLSDARGTAQILVMASAAALVTGAALAVHSWLDAPPERSARADPLRHLRQDRASSLAGATAAGIVLGGLLFPALVPGSTAGTWLGLALSGSPATALSWSELGALSAAEAGFSWRSAGDPTAICTAFVLPGVVFGGLVLLTRAWPRFVVARLLLAVQGKLPFRLMRFLGEARDTGLLRQSGGVYQFRHIRFQERLATRPASVLPAPGSAVARASRRVRSARRPVALAATALLALVFVQATPDDRMREISPRSAPHFAKVAVNRTGTVVAASTAGGVVRVWRRADWATIATGRPRGPIDALALSDDAKLLAAAVGPVTYVFRTTGLDEAPIAVFRHPRIPAAVPPDITALASAGHGGFWALGTGSGEVEVWRLKDGKRVASLRQDPDSGAAAVQALTVTRDGNRIGVLTYEYANGLTYGSYVRRGTGLVPRGRMELPASSDFFVGPVAVAVAPDPLTVAAFNGSRIHLLHDPAVEPPDSIDVGHGDDQVSGLAVSADGRIAAAVVAGVVCLWDLPAPAL